ncbi:MAG: hypothetical protein AB7T20_03370 [Steroidobacteraceae bacterium]
MGLVIRAATDANRSAWEGLLADRETGLFQHLFRWQAVHCRC